MGGNDEETLKNKTITNKTIRKSGSAALDMAYVAAGRYDGYFQKNLKFMGYSCWNHNCKRGWWSN